MARPEREVDPNSGPLGEFAVQLRKLRLEAGEPTYLRMARATGRSRTALAEAAGGDHLATWETVHAYVTACGGDVAVWRRRWQQVRDELDDCVALIGDTGQKAHMAVEPPSPPTISDPRLADRLPLSEGAITHATDAHGGTTDV